MWEDSSTTGDNEIHVFSGTPTVQYTNIQGGWSGTGNINLDPIFADTVHFYLDPSSPCIDAGNPDASYNDLEDPDRPGFARFPAMGTLRNDMGAYGGPGIAEWIITGIKEDTNLPNGNWPDQLELYQNFPNPFNPTTTIKYFLPTGGKVEIAIFNALGQRIKVWVNPYQEAGAHKVVWDGTTDSGQQAGSGLYFYRIRTGQHTIIRKMILLR
ncbi:MAG: T9SS type A sorting domain-containing protein [Calditrichaeota bacterium]|nr:T9SS type A sorting domain-containing protein [Calditrichota bacterium]